MDNLTTLLIMVVLGIHVLIGASAAILDGWPLVVVWVAGGASRLWATYTIETIKARRARWLVP